MEHVDIFLVDANRLFREGLKQLLDRSEFTVVGEAETIEEGLQAIAAGISPQVVLVELDVAEEQMAALRRLREIRPDVKLVILANSTEDVHHLARCFEAGSDAYLLKTISPDALQQSVRLVLSGEKVFPTRLAAVLVRTASTPRPVAPSADLESLSNRENQILRCLLNGHPNKVIAKALNITEATVKVHLKGVLKKINAANRTQAAIWALNNGLTTDSLPSGHPSGHHTATTGA